MNIMRQVVDCYRVSTDKELYSIVKRVSPIIPPLNEGDVSKLALSLPILATLLSRLEVIIYENDLSAELSLMLPSLCEFSMGKDSDSTTRSSASSIIYSIIIKCPQNKNDLVSHAFKSCISPTLLDASKRNDRGMFCDALQTGTIVVSSLTHLLLLLIFLTS